MEQTAALNAAKSIYNYYYESAIKEFEPSVADRLAKIPADYVYYKLINNPECYIDSGCCLEYCNEILDSEFNSMDRNLKIKAYEKAFGVKVGNISMSEINIKLKAKRRNAEFKKLYIASVKNEKDINGLSEQLVGLMGVKRKNTDENLENVFKSMKI